MSCIVVDDEQHAIDVLVHFIKQVPFLELRGTSTSPLQALQMVNAEKVDLVFLDVQMPDISGIDFIKAINGKCKVILTTAYSEFAAEGFELEVVDYLLKPVPFPRFLKAVQRVADSIESRAESSQVDMLEDDYLFVKTEAKGKMLRINLQDIDYIESLKNYVAFHYNGTRTLALLSMKELDDRLPVRHFMRVNRSFIIALRRITGVEGNMIRLRNIDTPIVLGDTYRAAFMEKMKGKLMG
ncbi:MAG: response regulator transcription factor [Chitinophagaceae bacterium]|nr:MAG: response regulator transcription factor [Chitinophagaceae bacterium]